MEGESASHGRGVTGLVASRPFHLVAWDGGCLFIGRGGGMVPVHAHYALQIAFGSEPGIRFRTREQGDWTEYAGAIIPSRQPHAMDVTRVPANVVLFVEPETPEGRAITERHLRDGIAAIPHELFAEVAPPLFAACFEARSGGAVERAAQRVVHALSGGVEPSVVTDERILRSVAHIKAHLDRPLTLDDVADVACLSPSRFRHLFVEQTGVGLRPYVLWRRFLRVWELLTAGESLSAAAHAAGFADAAHLSRTSRSMFGFPPSAMQMAGPLRDDGGTPVSARDAAYPVPGQPLRSIADRSPGVP
jgi:AraC family transcriptional regulator